jgi:Fic family protein
MNPDDFKNSPSGQLVPTIDRCMAFVPNPLPPKGLDLAKLIKPLEMSVGALGELSGVGRTLPDPELLVRPFSRVEAVASSKIEGTVSPTPELLMLERSPDAPVRSDTREVNNYNRALRRGLRRLSDLPLSKRLFCELHGILLEGVSIDRGAKIVPGELKKNQNWIGSRSIQTARFIPPPPKEAMDTLDELEKFIHADDELPLLIKLALVHYQFEAIHPFPDGNGRVGRLIIPLMLSEKGAMSQPLLYVSTFFEKNYDEYIDRMFNVSRSGDWNGWTEFFLRAIHQSSLNALKKAHAIQDLYKRYMTTVRSARSSVLLTKLIDALFVVPAITIPYAEKSLGISYNSAKAHIQRLTELQILVPNVGDERPQWYFALEIIDLVNSQDPWKASPASQSPRA